MYIKFLYKFLVRWKVKKFLIVFKFIVKVKKNIYVFDFLIMKKIKNFKNLMLVWRDILYIWKKLDLKKYG